MSFQIHALDPTIFAPLFALDDDELAARHAVRQIVVDHPGTPCRVSLEDARVGEAVLLVHHEHHPATSPYRASHAVFVRERVARARPAVNEVPPVLSSRLLSVRAFDAAHMMIDAEVVDGGEVASLLERWVRVRRVEYVHLHNAGPGCFAASATRATECCQ